MKLRDDVQMYDVHIDDIERLFSFVDSNRCHGGMYGEYSDQEIKVAESRIKQYKHRIFEKYCSWCASTPMVVHKVLEEGGKMYITDGQGRYEALLQMRRDGITEIDTIPVLVRTVETRDEMDRDIIQMNTNQKNWNNDDLLHYDAVKNGGDSAQVYRIKNEITNTLKCTSSTAYLIMFGQGKYSHKEKLFDRPIDELLSPRMEETFNFFQHFYNSTQVRSKKLNKKVTKVDIATTLDSVITSVYALYNDDKPKFNRVLDKCCNILIKAFNAMDDISYMHVTNYKSAALSLTFINFLKRYSSAKDINAVIDHLEMKRIGNKKAA